MLRAVVQQKQSCNKTELNRNSETEILLLLLLYMYYDYKYFCRGTSIIIMKARDPDHTPHPHTVSTLRVRESKEATKSHHNIHANSIQTGKQTKSMVIFSISCIRCGYFLSV